MFPKDPDISRQVRKSERYLAKFFFSKFYLCNLLSLHIPTEQCATDALTFVQVVQSLCLATLRSLLM